MLSKKVICFYVTIIGSKFVLVRSAVHLLYRKLHNTLTCPKMLPIMISCVILKGCSLRLAQVIETTLNAQHTAKYKLFPIYKQFPLIHSL